MSGLLLKDSPNGFVSDAEKLIQRLLRGELERQTKQAEKQTAKQANESPAEMRTFRAILRGMRQDASEGRTFDGENALWQALACTDFSEPNPVIEWEDSADACILDIDYHDKPAPYNFRNIVDVMKPAPAAWWFSRSGGAHLLYLPAGPLDAKEHAAIGRMILRDLLPAAEFELLHKTRHPGYPCEGRDGGTALAREVVRGLQNPADLERAWRSLLSEFDTEAPLNEDARDAWLDEQGMVIGGHFSHSHCPFEPSERGKNDSVRCLPEYVYCHVCKRGASYNRLAKVDLPVVTNHLRNAVRHKAHWEHARHFIQDKEGYRALLTLYHLQDGDAKKETARRELIDRVFDPDLMLIHCERVWVQNDFRPAAEKGLIDLISSLPALQYVDENGEIRLSKKRRALFLGTFDLTRFGYPEVIPLHGVDIAEHARFDESRPHFDPPVYAVIPSSPPFEYVKDAASQLPWAKEHLERHYPGAKFNLIEWLIFIKGCFQLGYIDEVIVTFITGQSEGGKTAHAKLAGMLAFEQPELVRLRKDQERFKQDFADASRIGTLAIVNEAGKDGLTGSDVHQTILSLERGMRYHHLYFGPRKVQNPAAPVMTNPKMPDEIREDKQTRRRCIEFPLGAGIQKPGEKRDWYESCQTGKLQFWLTRDATGDNLKCARIIVSYVMNKYFGLGANPRPAEVARQLGIYTSDEAASNTHTTLAELFELWKTAPRFQGTNNIWRGGGAAGWVVFNPNEDTPIAKVYMDATDQGGNIERVEAEAWPQITGVADLVCEIVPRKNRPQVGLRFGFRSAEGGWTPL